MDARAELAETLCQEFSRISGDRGNFESVWQQIAERILPSYSNVFNSDSFRSKGEQNTEKVFDSTASIALKRFAAILDSLLTPRNATWHRLMASEPALNKDRNVKLWFEEVNRILFKYRYAPKANFSAQNQQNYLGLGAFGTGCLFTDPLKDEAGIRYRAIHLGEVYFCENHQGIVDSAYRKFPLTARQAIQKWGEAVPSKIREAMNSSKERSFDFLHCVKPRQDYDPVRLDYKGMPYASYYVAIDEKVLLAEEGYHSFPYSISRYEQAPGEVYGRSPAMDVLPAIKVLNEEKKTVLKQGHRTVDPVLLAHDDGILDTFSMRPGALNAGGVSADGRPLVHTLPVGNIMIGKELMDDERMVINDAFLVTLFQILTETPTMTATEVMERTREKGILLAPTVGRQQSEYLGPMIEREIDVLSRQFSGGRPILPPMPPALREAQGEYRIEYDSPLSRAQRAEEVTGYLRSVERTLEIVNATQDPSYLDHYDFDVIIPEASEIQGMPIRWMRAVEQIQAIRQSRAQQQQQTDLVNALPGVAAITKAGAVAQKAGA